MIEEQATEQELVSPFRTAQPTFLGKWGAALRNGETRHSSPTGSLFFFFNIHLRPPYRFFSLAFGGHLPCLNLRKQSRRKLHRRPKTAVVDVKSQQYKMEFQGSHTQGLITRTSGSRTFIKVDTNSRARKVGSMTLSPQSFSNTPTCFQTKA